MHQPSEHIGRRAASAFSCRHRFLTICTDYGLSASATYAGLSLFLPSRWALPITWAGTLIVWLAALFSLKRGSWNPVTGTFLRASPGWIAAATIPVGFYSVYLLSTGQVLAAYLPMASTLCGALLVVSSARHLEM